MDIDCSILVKVGFVGRRRNGIRVVLAGLQADLAARDICLTWNTEYDWVYDKATPGSPGRWAVAVYGDGRNGLIKAAAEARIREYFATGDMLGLDDTTLDAIDAEG